ncbi:MAG TPA: TIGR04211 family SH3 domain-containing protein [Desulfobulbus sp.]|nr:TIGR04211 family SH3 domain-containing protein [Desulfobulbus sp.]
MKTFLTCILVAFTFALCIPATAFSAAAAGWYVKPSAEVPLRRGQGKGYKIIAVVSNGTPVKLISENNEWARIRLASGKEGWLLKRYLSPNKPLKDQVTSLQQKNSQLEEKLGETKSRLNELAAAHHKTEQELTDCFAARDKAKNDFQKLQQDTQDVVSTKKELALARKQLEVLKKRLADLQLENTGLKKSSSLIWFLVGAGVLLVGWLIGLITGKRTKKRRSSLL